MAEAGDKPATSALVLEAYLAAGDARFLPELFASTDGAALRGLPEPWLRDPRPFARDALRRYIADGCDRRGHRQLVKRLFKLAEAAGDDTLVGHFMVAFDRLDRRKLVDRRQYDSATRAWVMAPTLERDRKLPGSADTAGAAGRFSRRTRGYLFRRAFRYFRTVGRRDPARYGQAVRAALALYEDAHLATPESLLDAWGLVHVMYWGSPVLVRKWRGVRLAPGRALSELAPAPIYPDAWRGCFDAVLALFTRARSRTVRVWALALLRAEYAAQLRALAPAHVVALLTNAHDEPQALGAEILRDTADLAALPLATWLTLLALPNPAVVGAVCDVAVRYVGAAHLTLGQAVAFAGVRVAPVAALGLRWARAKTIATEADLAELLPLGNAGVAAVRAEAAAWIVALVAQAPFARPEHLRELVDARYADTRAVALELLEDDARFHESTALWAALVESPHDDVRAVLIRRMSEWEARFAAGELRHVWATALLAVHRGSRTKRAVLTQVAARLVAQPAEAAALVPLLRVALRSVRPPERRGALAAVARAARGAPALRAALGAHVPELTLDAGEAWA